MVPVILWPMVPYLETQNTAEDTGLEQRRGKRWRGKKRRRKTRMKRKGRR